MKKYLSMDDLCNIQRIQDPELFMESIFFYYDILTSSESIQESGLSNIFKLMSKSSVDPDISKRMKITRDYVRSVVKDADAKGVSIISITSGITLIVVDRSNKAAKEILKGNMSTAFDEIETMTVGVNDVVVDSFKSTQLSKYPIGFLTAFLTTVACICITFFFIYLMTALGVTGMAGALFAITLSGVFCSVFITERMRLFSIKKGFYNEFVMGLNTIIILDILTSKTWIAIVAKVVSFFSNLFTTAIQKVFTGTQNEKTGFWISVMISIVTQIFANTTRLEKMGDTYTYRYYKPQYDTINKAVANTI